MVIAQLEHILSIVSEKLGYGKLHVKKSNIADYQCDDLFNLAKTYHKSPAVIGEEIVSEINKLDNFNDYDYVLNNDSDLDSLRDKVNLLTKEIFKGDE